MTDIYCKVCREPRDSYGLRHGDMDRAEADVLLKGLGCPCCCGVSPGTEDIEEIQQLKHEYSSALESFRSKPRITKLTHKDMVMEELGLSTLGDCDKYTWKYGLFSYKCQGCDDWEADKDLLEDTINKCVFRTTSTTHSGQL